MLSKNRAVQLLARFGILSVMTGGLLIAAVNSLFRGEETIAIVSAMTGFACMMITFVLFSKLYDHIHLTSPLTSE